MNSAHAQQLCILVVSLCWCKRCADAQYVCIFVLFLCVFQGEGRADGLGEYKKPAEAGFLGIYLKWVTRRLLQSLLRLQLLLQQLLLLALLRQGLVQ